MNFNDTMLKYGKIEDCPIIDMHTHWGKYDGAALPAVHFDQCINLFKASNVQKVIISSHQALHSLFMGNRATLDTAEKAPDLFRVLYCINPNYPDNMKKDLEDWDRHGDLVVGLKTLADYNEIPLDRGDYDQAFEFANEKGCLFLFHTWDSDLDGPKQIKYVLDKYPNIKVSCGHSLHGKWDISKNYALDYENYYFDIVALPDEREVIEKYFSEPKVVDKMFFGTDFPWFSYNYYIGAMLDTGLDEESLRKVFYKNAQRVFPWAR